jgi:hypothetical protein
MIFQATKPLPGRDGDIKETRAIADDFNIFPVESEATRTPETQLGQGSEEFYKPLADNGGFLCHHPTCEAVSDDAIRIALACHTVRYARAMLAQINQVCYHLIRQRVAGMVSATAMSGLLAARMLPVMDRVAYSCHWAERQMQRWWGNGMSATTMRRVRDELEGWGCFQVRRVKPGSTGRVTALECVDLKRLLQIAAWVFRRIADEPDGVDKYLPSHRCGFLAALWRLFFPGTFYAPNLDLPPHDAAAELNLARSRLEKVEQMATEFGWSDFLCRNYREQADRLKRHIRNLEEFLPTATQIDFLPTSIP